MGYRSMLVGFVLQVAFVGCNNVTDEDVLKKWTKLENNLQLLVDGLVKRIRPMLDKYFPRQNVSSECRESLRAVFDGVQRLQTWALKFLDSSGRPMTNVMSGSFSAPGLFDECIGIVAPDQISHLGGNKSKLSFRGQYCTVNFRPPLPPKPKRYFISKPLPEFAKFKDSDLLVEWGGYKYAQIFYFLSFRLGFCFPSTCSREDIRAIIDAVAENTISLKSEISHCEVQEFNNWTREQIVATVILGIPIMLAVIGTCINYYLRVTKTEYVIIKGKTRKTITLILEAFSIDTNVRKIMNTEKTEETLSSLHGIRFLSLSWVVLGHTYYFINFQQIRNILDVRKETEKVMFQIVLNASVSVDTFFFISGLLVVYVTLEKLTEMERKTINIPFLILHRIWRLWPPLLATILFTFFVPWTGSGPYWHETIDHIVDNCKHRWWATAIFVNNFLDKSKTCLAHTWYISSDFQLYVFAVFALAVFLRRPIWAFILSATVAVVGMITVGYITKVYEFGPTMLLDRPDMEEAEKMLSLVYFRPYTHSGAYCFGMAIGYLLHKRKKIKMKLAFKLLGWSVAIACNLAILFATQQWNKGNYPSQDVIATYASIHRTAWCIGISWTIVVCCTGNCEIVRKFLSWGAFVPFSRLSFFAYLLHYIISITIVAINRQSVHGQHIYTVSSFLMNLTITYLLSLPASLIYESPLLALEKILFSARKSATSDNHELSNDVSQSCKDTHNPVPEPTADSRI